jgi:competence protein CoiA
MLTAIDDEGKTVMAHKIAKGNTGYLCPVCNRPVLLKKGDIKIAHFAHVKDEGCEAGQGETQQHLQAKMGIYQALDESTDCLNIAMERNNFDGIVRPDISGWIKNTPVVIEVQRSNLTIDTIEHRFAEYTRRGIYMLWVLLHAPCEHGKQYRFKSWERHLRLRYNGCIYFYHSGETLWSTHLVQCSGLKTISTAYFPYKVNITEDFKPYKDYRWIYQPSLDRGLNGRITNPDRWNTDRFLP